MAYSIAEYINGTQRTEGTNHYFTGSRVQINKLTVVIGKLLTESKILLMYSLLYSYILFSKIRDGFYLQRS